MRIEPSPDDRHIHRPRSAERPLQTMAADSSRAWRFDEFVLDMARYELSCLDKPVAVEPQVFNVLAHLVANHGRVISREELIDTVWGSGRGSDASLSTRIKGARQALGDTGESQRYIRTVRGRGFQFVGNPSIVRHSWT